MLLTRAVLAATAVLIPSPVAPAQLNDAATPELQICNPIQPVEKCSGHRARPAGRQRVMRAFSAALLLISGCVPVRHADTRSATTSAPQCQKPQIVLVKPDHPVAPNSTYYSDGAPPARFRADNQVEVVFRSPTEVARICGGGTPPTCGMQILACQQGGKIYMPNPCGSAEEFYGRLLCHELGHLNGWPSTHGD